MATEFGKFILQRKLAEGGMAEVFLAKQAGMEGFEKPVVVKRILPHLTNDDAFVQMFLNEARVAARLSHPSIVQIFDLGKVGEQYYIAMEFIHGEDLRQVAKQAEKMRARPSFAMVSRVVADMLGALHYAHTRSGPDGKPLGLVHRDISPQNVLVTYEGGVKLVDFGIAKATESQAGQQTQAGLLKGKYAYMSPEQCRGKKLDARSDIFAVGILLWELITWRRLFRRDNDLATLVAVADDPIPTLQSIRSDVPMELDRICARALERDLNQRYPTAQSMQADLEAVIRKYAWEADSITLSRYMRTIFAEKLRQQDDAVRAAGLGSLEDFLVRVDQGTQLAWMDKPNATSQTPAVALPFRDPSHPTGTHRPVEPGPISSPMSGPISGQLPSLGAPSGVLMTTPSGPIPIVASSQSQVAPPPSQSMPPRRMEYRTSEVSRVRPPAPGQPFQIAPVPQPQRPMYPTNEEHTPSTMRHAVGQKVPVAQGPQSSGTTLPGTQTYQPQGSGVKRFLIVALTGVLVAGAVLTAVFWPDSGPSGGTVQAAGDDTATLKIELDAPARIFVDGKLESLEAKSAEVKVAARKPHEVRVKPAGGPERKQQIPALEPGTRRIVNFAEQ